jgi:hypothetical protein
VPLFHEKSFLSGPPSVSNLALIVGNLVFGQNGAVFFLNKEFTMFRAQNKVNAETREGLIGAWL